jgi:hypothetical protein
MASRTNGRLIDVLRGVSGLRVECRSACTAQMVRSTTCEPKFFLNGFPAGAEILMTPVPDLAGVEIYRGPSEMPGEFLGSNSMCGALSIWTLPAERLPSANRRAIAIAA